MIKETQAVTRRKLYLALHERIVRAAQELENAKEAAKKEGLSVNCYGSDVRTHYLSKSRICEVWNTKKGGA